MIEARQEVRYAGLRIFSAIGFAAVALVLAAGSILSPLRAEEKPDAKKAAGDETSLRAELLKLNSVTGEEAQKNKLIALYKNKERARKLVIEAGKMFKEAAGAENPFKYNGALMVARLAHANKQFEIAEQFYEYLIDVATKLKSGE